MANDQIQTDRRSYFDGGGFAYFGMNLIVKFVSIITLGIAYPFMKCRLMRWECKHTVVEGRRLRFDGNGAQLIGKYILWLFLTVITVGIYGFWMSIAIEKWKVKHTHYEDSDGESYFDGGIGGYFGIKILAWFLNAITLFIAKPWMDKKLIAWEKNHTVVDYDRFTFRGTGGSLLGKYIIWWLLTFVTVGIYRIFVPVRKMNWIAERTFVGERKAKDEKRLQSGLGAGYTPTPNAPAQPQKSDRSSIIIPIAVFGGIAVLVAAVFGFRYFKTKKTTTVVTDIGSISGIGSGAEYSAVVSSNYSFQHMNVTVYGKNSTIHWTDSVSVGRNENGLLYISKLPTDDSVSQERAFKVIYEGEVTSSRMIPTVFEFKFKDDTYKETAVCFALGDCDFSDIYRRATIPDATICFGDRSICVADYNSADQLRAALASAVASCSVETDRDGWASHKPITASIIYGNSLNGVLTSTGYFYIYNPETGEFSAKPVNNDKKYDPFNIKLSIIVSNFSPDGVGGDSEPEISEPEVPVDNGTYSPIGKRYVVFDAGKLNLRESPNTKANVVTVMVDGDTMTILEERNGWYRVNCNGNVGWCAKDYVAPVGTTIVRPEQNTDKTLKTAMNNVANFLYEASFADFSSPSEIKNTDERMCRHLIDISKPFKSANVYDYYRVSDLNALAQKHLGRTFDFSKTYGYKSSDKTIEVEDFARGGCDGSYVMKYAHLHDNVYRMTIATAEDPGFDPVSSKPKGKEFSDWFRAYNSYYGKYLYHLTAACDVALVDVEINSADDWKVLSYRSKSEMGYWSLD